MNRKQNADAAVGPCLCLSASSLSTQAERSAALVGLPQSTEVKGCLREGPSCSTVYIACHGGSRCVFNNSRGALYLSAGIAVMPRCPAALKVTPHTHLVLPGKLG